jgi:hypothetical protein
MRSSFMSAITYQSTTKFLPGSKWFLGSLQFITDKFRDLTLQEPESRKVIGSGTDPLPSGLVRVSLINETHLGHGLSKLGKMDLDPAEDKANHNLAVLTATTDPIYQSSPESDFEGGGEVYMMGNGEKPLEKTVEEIQREAEEEIALAACLAKEAERGKRHNGLQDDSCASKDEPRDGAPMRRHHPKFNSRHPADRDRFQNRSRSIQEELGRIEYQGEQVYRTPA